MKKEGILVALLLVFCLLLSGCGHEHVWEEANCTTPKTCKECGEKEGQALGHDWKEATCTSPKTCSRCGATEGKALEHVWVLKEIVEPSCTWQGYSVYECSVCGRTESRDKTAALNHDMKEATCTDPATCSRCGVTRGNALGHDSSNVTCTEDGTCTRCGVTIPALGHEWSDATCTEPKTCSRCGATEGEPLGHEKSDSVRENVVSPTCVEDGHYDKVVYCSRCHKELSRKTVTDKALGHTTNNGVCSRCGETIIEPIVFSGTGDKVINNVDVPSHIYKVVLKNEGSSNFIVHAYTASGERLHSLANEIGNYEGSIFFSDNIEGGILEVKSKGKWKITFKAIPEGGTSNISGKGDWVSPWFYIKSGALAVTMTNTGDSNFIVHIYDEFGNRYSSLANEIGKYNGATVFNRGEDGVKYCIEVISNGKWTVDFGLDDEVTKK